MKPDGLSCCTRLATCERRRSSILVEKYIFMNSMVPAMSQLADAAEGKFVIEDWENYGHHYSTTLPAWHDRFNANWDRIRSLKTARPFDERFRRMWNYYLMSCKAAFDVETAALWQLRDDARNSGRGVYRRVLRGSPAEGHPTASRRPEQGAGRRLIRSVRELERADRPLP